jgi:hypothetical protein
MGFVKAHTFYSIVMQGAYVYHSNGSSKLSISKKKKNFRATSKKSQNWGMAPEVAHTLKLKAHEGAQRMESLQLIKTPKFEIFIYFRATSFT